IEIKVVGRIGKEPLSHGNFDIREIKALFDVVETLLYPNSKLTRAPITYSLEEGSVRNIFKTTLQSAATFLATLNLVNQSRSLAGLELSTARAFQEIQKSAVKNDFTYEFGTPDNVAPSLVISRHTSYRINENLWANTEFYFYGTVINAGGKDKTNIHLQTKDYGLITIATPREILETQKENILYRHFTVRAKGKQNIATREMDPGSFELLEMTPFDPNYNEQYLANLIKRASPRWNGVKDADKWLSKIRGING
ncbi:MAG: hypothetical protein K2L00_06160, partial [Muribaculaceae bacterium]|nr:hypothetical protein [Muribaculaceae bacterium]